jgi:hypothetical protein
VELSPGDQGSLRSHSRVHPLSLLGRANPLSETLDRYRGFVDPLDEFAEGAEHESRLAKTDDSYGTRRDVINQNDSLNHKLALETSFVPGKYGPALNNVIAREINGPRESRARPLSFGLSDRRHCREAATIVEDGIHHRRANANGLPRAAMEQQR